MEGEAQNLDHETLIQSPLKRKCDPVPDEEVEVATAMKQKKLDAPLEELLEASHDDDKEGVNQNGNASKEKGKSILSAADKGKGKMVVDEEEGGDEKRVREFGVSSDEEDGSSEVNGDGDGDDDDTDFDDDPLAEMDLDNILPVRTRQRSALEPGAYLVEGDDDDDDDEDDEEEEEEEDEEDEEVDEGEGVEDEDKQEEIK